MSSVPETMIERKETLSRPARFYRPELDVLRFVAFFAVFTFHSVPQKMEPFNRIARVGALGMCLFFVLSSFLITELLRLEKGRSGSVRIGSFYMRRILRIWPLYILFLLSAFTFGHFFPSSYIPFKTIAAMLLLSGNWYISIHGFPPLVEPLWSISVEEQFYLVWPTLCKQFSRRILIAISVLLLLLGAAAITWLSITQRDRGSVIWLNSLVQFQMFGMGALLAIHLNGRVPHFKISLRAFLAGAAISCFMLAQYVFQIQSGSPPAALQLIAGYLCAGIGSCLLILSLLGAALPSIFRPLIYLGKISYGLYVFHIVFLELAMHFGSAKTIFGIAGKFLFALGCTILTAALSYRYLESPFIRLKKRFEVIPSRAA